MKVVIVKYNAGNIRSVAFALERLGITPSVSDNIEEITSADKVIFPGVGSAATAMAYLRERRLDEVIKTLKQPVLGICLGLQLLCRNSEEGEETCLGVFDTDVKKFHSIENSKVPHTGWNQVGNNKGQIMNGIEEGSDMYFVHSYYAELCESTAAITDYILPFSAVLEKGNFYAAQFHIEKSGLAGEQILQNFINIPWK